MNLILCAYIAGTAFSFGHFIGWHRGRNYAEDKRDA